ncbi:MAG: hypothetical protein IPM59_07765 [Chloracidobacterium sp.]|nr:hypothetical protein [Chloracidobacterium sp.]
MIRAIAGTLLFLVCTLAVAGGSEAKRLDTTAIPHPTPETIVFTGYRGIAIGMGAKAVREKLDNPKEKSDTVDLYIFSDDESAQFFYDDAKMVNAIMITYTGNLEKALTPKAIFGEEAETRPDGGAFKMVRYPKAGFWISYNRSGGEDAVISIAVQKI